MMQNQQLHSTTQRLIEKRAIEKRVIENGIQSRSVDLFLPLNRPAETMQGDIFLTEDLVAHWQLQNNQLSLTLTIREPVTMDDR